MALECPAPVPRTGGMHAGAPRELIRVVLRGAAICGAVLVAIPAAAQTPPDPAANTAADAQPEARESTLAARLGIRAAHFSLGGGSRPYLNAAGGAPTSELRLGVTLNRFPEWTLAYAGSTVREKEQTGYVAPSSDGFQPRLNSATEGFQVQYRHAGGRTLHPIAAVGFGGITHSYNYFLWDAAGRRTYHEDEKTTGRYVSLAVGGEANIARWLRTSLLIGYRAAPELNITHARARNTGVTSELLLSMGRF
jgi:hypothetical protein